MTPARYKHQYVRRQVEAGVPLGEAIWGMQTRYIGKQRETLFAGTFVDWLE